MDEDSGLQQELELLEAIYLEDFNVEHSVSGNAVSRVRVKIQPATGDNADEKYVCLTLEFNLSSSYPNEVPEMVISNPRGLADDHIMKLRQDLRELAAERAGMPMLYELIELGKESLTESNIPHGQCVICLEVLATGELFVKTECYHYFHSGCLLRYIEHCNEEMEKEREEIRQHKHMTVEQKDVVCPVCREPIETDLDTLRAQAPPTEEDPETIVVSPEIRSLQLKMAALYARQQAKGGIIDVEAERNKFLIPSETSGPEPHAQPAPLHLFSQNQLPANLAPVLHGHGRGRGQIYPGQFSERTGRERGEKRDSRNAHRRDNRHKERRNPGQERSREDRGRPNSSGRHYQNYREEPDRKMPTKECSNETIEKNGSGCLDGKERGEEGHERSFHHHRSRRGGKQFTERDGKDHRQNSYYEKGGREEMNGEVCSLQASEGSGSYPAGKYRDHRRQPRHFLSRNGDMREQFEPGHQDRHEYNERPTSRGDGRRWRGRGRGRNYHEGDGDNFKTGKESDFYEESSKSRDNKNTNSSQEHRSDYRRPEHTGRGRSEPRIDRRKQVRPHSAGKSSSDRCNFAERDYNREQNAVKFQSPPGFSEHQRQPLPPDSRYCSITPHSKPSVPPGFKTGS